MADYKKPDYWQQKARKEGFPARSVYKLKEIDEKFCLFNANHSPINTLDLGAAPGSWSLYILRKIVSAGKTFAEKSYLTAADLLPLSREFDRGLFDSVNFHFIQGDITAAQVREAILARGPYSTIISDTAPNTTGNHTVDAARSLELAETVITYAESALASGGNLVFKIFQGSSSGILLKQMKAMFDTAKSFKPQACRGESVETYYMGLGKQ